MAISMTIGQLLKILLILRNKLNGDITITKYIRKCWNRGIFINYRMI